MNGKLTPDAGESDRSCAKMGEENSLPGALRTVSNRVLASAIKRLVRAAIEYAITNDRDSSRWYIKVIS
ncbi:hypothetical protein KCP76_24945 [Salmonella enterica subsp. enterica serovar Weltevreden]|nr:hypothetical protein KCP76_24945 [Salmonella enterica subsp. enterica serovar Weltevreden]